MGIKFDDFGKICRTCLSQESLVPILGSSIQEGALVKDVLGYFIQQEDLINPNLPQQICSVCVTNLNVYNNFKAQCSQSETLLKSLLEEHVARANCKSESDSEVNINQSNDWEFSSDDDRPLIDRAQKVKNKNTQLRNGQKTSRVQKRIKDDDFKDFIIKYINDKRYYACTLCDKAFDFKNKLKIHVRVHTKEKPYMCDKCPLSFSMKGNLKRHLMTHTGERPHVCEVCGKGFIQVACLHAHTQKYHSGDNNEDLRTKITCQYCGRDFVRTKAYNWHMKKHHSDHVEASVEESMNTDGEEIKIEVPKGEYSCDICGNTFARKLLLKKHQTRHGEKKFLCSECGKGFVRKADLQSHLKVHTGEKPHKCSICNKSFAHAGTLVAHTLMHSGFKPHTCYICSKSFTQSAHLKTHIRIHNGERPYSCTFCDKAFSLKQNLIVHVRTHTGETPYKCTVCHRGFYDSSSLKKHQSSHLNMVQNIVKKDNSLESMPI